jgi:hypothetical protein
MSSGSFEEKKLFLIEVEPRFPDRPTRRLLGYLDLIGSLKGSSSWAVSGSGNVTELF